MTRTVLAIAAALALSPASSFAADAARAPLSLRHDGVDYGVAALLQYDFAGFHGQHAPRDRDDWRRATVGVYARNSGVFDVVADYDFKAEAWLDAYLRVETQAGALRLGQFRTPVGLDDGGTSSGSTVFMERALPEAVVHQGRRLGLDWTRALGTRWLFNLGAYRGGDLGGLHEGHSVAGRAVFTPRNDENELLHFGASASREQRDDRSARLRGKPEAALSDRYYLDSGALPGSDAIDRYALEAIWRRGPWSLQGEWLGIAARRDGMPGGSMPGGSRPSDGRAQGGYVQGSWMLSGETKPYKRGALSNPRPQHASGAVELAARWSTLRIDAPATPLDRQSNWALGVNWYVGTHMKLMANYVNVDSRAAHDLDIVELRIQLML